MPMRKEGAAEAPSSSISGTFAIISVYEQTAETAHRLRNLMTVATCLTEMLVAGELQGDEAHAAHLKLQEVIGNAGRLTKQLLTSCKQSPPKPVAIDLSLVVAGYLNVISRILGSDITVCTTLTPRLGKVMIDPQQLEQVVVNLIINARDAMPNGGQLNIETKAGISDDRDSQSLVVLTVRDTGIGMDEDEQAYIFEPFFTTKAEGKGTGLGLATVQKIIQSAGGSIEVQSTKNAGANFVIQLPCVSE